MHRWLRTRGLGRQMAVILQASAFAFLFSALWVAFNPTATAPAQLAIFWVWQFLVAYAAVLLRVRRMRPS